MGSGYWSTSTYPRGFFLKTRVSSIHIPTGQSPAPRCDSASSNLSAESLPGWSPKEWIGPSRSKLVQLNDFRKKHTQIRHLRRSKEECRSRTNLGEYNFEWGPVVITVIHRYTNKPGLRRNEQGAFPPFAQDIGRSQSCVYIYIYIYCLVVDLPLWKIWLRQLGWWHSQLNRKS